MNDARTKKNEIFNFVNRLVD